MSLDSEEEHQMSQVPKVVPVLLKQLADLQKEQGIDVDSVIKCFANKDEIPDKRLMAEINMGNWIVLLKVKQFQTLARLLTSWLENCIIYPIFPKDFELIVVNFTDKNILDCLNDDIEALENMYKYIVSFISEKTFNFFILFAEFIIDVTSTEVSKDLKSQALSTTFVRLIDRQSNYFQNSKISDYMFLLVCYLRRQEEISASRSKFNSSNNLSISQIRSFEPESLVSKKQAYCLDYFLMFKSELENSMKDNDTKKKIKIINNKIESNYKPYNTYLKAYNEVRKGNLYRPSMTSWKNSKLSQNEEKSDDKKESSFKRKVSCLILELPEK